MTQFRELTASEIRSVVGGDNSAPLGGALGPQVDGVVAAAAATLPDTVGGATTGVNGVITALDNAVTAS